jgi:hypothetical protein
MKFHTWDFSESMSNWWTTQDVANAVGRPVAFVEECARERLIESIKTPYGRIYQPRDAKEFALTCGEISEGRRSPAAAERAQWPES